MLENVKIMLLTHLKRHKDRLSQGNKEPIEPQPHTKIKEALKIMETSTTSVILTTKVLIKDKLTQQTTT